MTHVAPLADALPGHTRSGFVSFGSTLRPLALVAIAMLLILVILPAVLGAAGIQVVAPA